MVVKLFLGKTGNFDGDEVLDILLEQKQTANFITQKIYKFFVNEQSIHEKKNGLQIVFIKAIMILANLMEDIFTSDWFYDEKNIGAKIKSPIELLAGIQRMLPMKLENEEALILLQRVWANIFLSAKCCRLAWWQNMDRQSALNDADAITSIDQ